MPPLLCVRLEEALRLGGVDFRLRPRPNRRSAHIKLGAVLRTPGVRILPGGSFNVDVIDQRGAVSSQLAFFDSTNITFKYEVPLEAAVGAAWVSDVGEIEVNLKAQTGHSVYDGFSSTKSFVQITDSGDGTPVRRTTSSFPGIPFASRPIVSMTKVSISNIGILYSIGYVF
jgi:hypothetical protein